MNPQNQLVPFEGFSRPGSDFFAARSELRAPPSYRDIDLSVARSIAAGTAVPMTMAGNLVYIDQKANSGVATLHFQDDVSVGNAPVTVYPGFMAKVPFTQLILENAAQPGQVMRIIYGTDLDFTPVPSAAGVTVLNSLSINDLVSNSAQTLNYINAAEPVGFNANVMLLPANNPRGARIRSLMIQGQAGAGGTLNAEIFASLAAPVSIQAAQVNSLPLFRFSSSVVTSALDQETTLSRTIPAGWGIYCASQVATAAAVLLARAGVEVL